MVYAEKIVPLGYKGIFFSINTVTVNSTSGKAIAIETVSRPNKISFNLTQLPKPKPITASAKPSPAPNRQSQPLLNGTLTFRTNKQSQVSIGKLTAGTQTLTCNLKTSELNCTLETGLQTIIVTDYTLNLNPTDYIFEVTCTQNNLLDLPTIKATVKDSQNSETSITHTLKAKPRS